VIACRGGGGKKTPSEEQLTVVKSDFSKRVRSDRRAAPGNFERERDREFREEGGVRGDFGFLHHLRNSQVEKSKGTEKGAVEKELSVVRISPKLGKDKAT